MSARHTPGPWVACLGRFELSNSGQRAIVAGADGDVGRPHIAFASSRIARPRGTPYDAADDERDANARLLAAAPALLDAAEHAQCACSVRERDSGHLVGCWMPALLAAIALATLPAPAVDDHAELRARIARDAGGDG
jgi:hypothetical protein